jgi:hypothetical protein
VWLVVLVWLLVVWLVVVWCGAAGGAGVALYRAGIYKPLLAGLCSFHSTRNSVFVQSYKIHATVLTNTRNSVTMQSHQTNHRHTGGNKRKGEKHHD